MPSSWLVRLRQRAWLLSVRLRQTENVPRRLLPRLRERATMLLCSAVPTVSSMVVSRLTRVACRHLSLVVVW